MKIDYDKLKFRMVSHLGMDDFHLYTYKCSEGELKDRLAVQRGVPSPFADDTEKPFTNYILDGKLYDTKEEIIKAIEEL